MQCNAGTSREHHEKRLHSHRTITSWQGDHEDRPIGINLSAKKREKVRRQDKKAFLYNTSLFYGIVQEEKAMKCVICQYGETEAGTTTVTLTRGETTIVIRDVPAQICTTCGEDMWMQQRASDFLRLLKPL